jgi:hypothetical protein
VKECGVSSRHLQGQRAGDRSVTGLHRDQAAVLDDDSGHVDRQDQIELEVKGVHAHAVHHQVDRRLMGGGDLVRCELHDLPPAGRPQRFAGGVGQALLGAPGVDEHIPEV